MRAYIFMCVCLTYTHCVGGSYVLRFTQTDHTQFHSSFFLYLLSQFYQSSTTSSHINGASMSIHHTDGRARGKQNSVRTSIPLADSANYMSGDYNCPKRQICLISRVRLLRVFEGLRYSSEIFFRLAAADGRRYFLRRSDG